MCKKRRCVRICVCVCVCARACACECVRACARARACVCVCACSCASLETNFSHDTTTTFSVGLFCTLTIWFKQRTLYPHCLVQTQGTPEPSLFGSNTGNPCAKRHLPSCPETVQLWRRRCTSAATSATDGVWMTTWPP